MKVMLPTSLIGAATSVGASPGPARIGQAGSGDWRIDSQGRALLVSEDANRTLWQVVYWPVQ